MILLGLLLMAGCTALAVDAVVQNTGAIHAIVFNQSVTHLSLGAVFVAGAVVGLLFALGLLMFTGGLGRAGRKRRERKLAARKADAETQALREHNDRLAAELEQERSSSTYPTEDTTAATADERLSGRHRAR